MKTFKIAALCLSMAAAAFTVQAKKSNTKLTLQSSAAALPVW